MTLQVIWMHTNYTTWVNKRKKLTSLRPRQMQRRQLRRWLMTRSLRRAQPSKWWRQPRKLILLHPKRRSQSQFSNLFKRDQCTLLHFLRKSKLKLSSKSKKCRQLVRKLLQPLQVKAPSEWNSRPARTTYTLANFSSVLQVKPSESSSIPAQSI